MPATRRSRAQPEVVADATPAADPAPVAGGRWRWRLRNKIVVLLIAVVLAAQLATFGVVHVATERSVGGQLTEELLVGERVWQRYHDNRGNQLLQTARVLADDFGFKAAAASGDRATMASALQNQAARAGADSALLLSPDGEWLAGLDGADPAAQQAALAPLLAKAGEDGFALGVVPLAGRMHLLALLPVLAPDQVAWVAIGSEFGAGEAADFRELTRLDATFVQLQAGGLRIFGSSLPAAAQASLQRLPAGTLVADRAVRRELLGGDQYFVLAEPLAGGGDDGPVVVLLQASLDEAMAPYAALKTRILLLSGLAALLALLAAGFVARGVSQPVTQLAEAAQRIAAGDYSQPVQAEGSVEISGLASAFGLMQQGIAAREERILHQANHDGLTGLPNRAHARDRLEAEIAGAEGASAVLMLDLDRFKEINDTLGHGFGDQVLQEVGKRLARAVRAEDMVARLGGDEFLVLLREVGRDGAERRAQALLERLREPLDLPSTRINLGASIGLVLYPDHGTDAQTLLRRADIALYDAKEARSGVAVYSPGRDEVHLRQLALIGDLRQSIARGELGLRFQPKVDLAGGKVRHVEALLRWRHATLGWIPPDEFVPLAERSGFIHELTRFVLDEALRQSAAWRGEGLDLGVAVNLSAMDLMDADLPDYLQDCLHRHRVPPATLIVEVTESALMHDVEYAVRMLHRLRAGGIRLSIDDFGTGYSSLAQLKRMPVDELKIDKSFVMQMTDGSDDAVIVRSTIELGHNMGLAVIAEGVEDEASLQLLRRYRCDMAQGYFFTAPLEAGALRDWCRQFALAAA